MIELRHLRYFVAVAEDLHYGRAARRLNMAQSPLSHQIRQLEREIGTALIERGHHVVGLTEPGAVLLRSARAILADVKRAVRLCQQVGRREAGTLVVGYLPETAELLPVAIKRYRARFPDVDLELEERPAATLLAQLAEGSVDVAFVRCPLAAGGLAFEPLVSETFGQLAAPGRVPRGCPASRPGLGYAAGGGSAWGSRSAPVTASERDRARVPQAIRAAPRSAPANQGPWFTRSWNAATPQAMDTTGSPRVTPGCAAARVPAW
jgi:DNA-binding transcriptional LysR family regulator